MSQGWIELIKSGVLAVAGLKKYWKVICGFVAKVSMLDHAREFRQIENMTKYLEAVSKQLAAMKRAGVPQATIQGLAVSLNVPLIQANLEAMVIARQFTKAMYAESATPTNGGEVTETPSSSPESADANENNSRQPTQ